ncbi:hypothetical protein GJAV_G00093470 [Gymnothorax javanicus]|nr:hypothetical protein GJAV_G00093470 [Gymnothorax javanicus]
MARIFYSGIYLLLLHMLSVLIIKVNSNGLTKLQRQKREWIIPAKKLKENVDYRHQVIAKIRSDEESRTSIKYSLIGHGADKDPMGLFIVNPRTGEVYVTEILDREQRASYTLQGVAKFANNSLAERNIDLHIYVEDQNDSDPEFSIMKAAGVEELSQSGTLVMIITATDADDPLTPNGQVTYSILEQIPGDTPMFYVIKETGAVYVQLNTLDREVQSSYTLKVIGTDMNGEKGGRTGTGTVVINVLDVNDNVPTLEKSYYEASVEENTVNVEVMRIKAVDLDLIHTDNWRTVFSIVSGNEAGYFRITTDKKTNEGIVTLIKALDYEELKELNIRVAMRNKAEYHHSVTEASGSASYPIKIKVKNQPEGPRFSPVEKAISISENRKVVSTHTIIANYAAIDGDTLKVAENVWYAKLHDPANWLIIDEQTGDIKLNQIPDRESKYLINGTYIAKIICITRELPAKTATGTIFMAVEDFNDHCPVLTSTTHTACSYDTPLLVSAVDGDADPNGAPFHFRVVPEGTKQEWIVEPNDNRSVILRAEGQLWPGLYHVQLEVQDQQGKVCEEPQVLDVMVCSCEEEGAEKAPCSDGTTPSAVFGPAGVGFLLLALLLLLLVPLLLLFCTCGEKEFLMIPFETKEHLIDYHTERPGEDKEAPLLTVPTEVDSPIKLQQVDRVGAEGIMGGAAGMTGASLVGAGAGGMGGASGASFGEAAETGFRGAGTGHTTSSAWSYGKEMQGTETGGQYWGYGGYSEGAWDGLALPDEFLDEFYSQKSSCAEILASQLKDGLQIYEYEGEESPAGSVGCCSLIDQDDNLDFLNDLGPKFKTLAEICGGSAIESDSLTTASAHNIHFGGVAAAASSSAMKSETAIATKTTVTASKPPPARVVESLVTETHSAASTASIASAPRILATENVVASSPTYLVQTTPVVYAAAPVLPTTRYILEQPPLGATLLVTDRLGSAQGGMYVVNEAPHMGQTVLVRDQREMVTAGTVGLSEGVVLVERHRVMTEADAGQGHTLVRVGSPGPGSQNLLVVERQSATEPREVLVPLREMSAAASPNLLVVVESQSQGIFMGGW